MKWLLKAESPRDLSDLLLSLKHPPNIVLSDIPHMVAAHTNKRLPDFFNPYGGRPIEPTLDNIQGASDGTLPQVSLAWLNRIEAVAAVLSTKGMGKVHPITLTQQRLSVYDRTRRLLSKQTTLLPKICTF